MPRAVSKKSELTRDRILNAAYGLFIQKGFNATSMREIVEQASITMGGIYNHYASKEDIWIEVLLTRHPYHRILPLIQTAQGETTADLVRSAAHLLVNELNNEPNLMHLMFIEIVEFKSRHIPLIIERAMPEIMRLGPVVAGRAGHLRDIPLPSLVRAFAGLFFSYYVTGQLIGERPGIAFNKQVLDEFIDLFLFGLLADDDPARTQPGRPAEEAA